ncbi:MAG TPA: class I SAM-dependent methyltransferase [Rectinemataceae bacterium]|nr:class I SAM-dependent methyltransferase [Rectinemataceae bacterium]
MTDRDLRQAEYFRNRLVKNERQLRRWARREGVEALRLFDNDIPEIPLALERYGLGSEAAIQLALYERPYEKNEAEEAEWLGLMARTAAEALGVDGGSVFVKTRRRMRALEQYERTAAAAAERRTREGGLDFIVDLAGHLDTGLFLDHRPTRAIVREAAAGCEALNLFAYTGSFSVYAAAGAAASVTSVDLSARYLDWAGRNLELNGFSASRHPLVRADVRAFLAEAKRRGRRWDLIVVDPPTFSNSKRSPEDFDVNRDWPELLASCLAVCSPDASIYFSTNSRSFKWRADAVEAASEDISEATIPPDFRDRRIHRCWKLKAP